MRAVHSCISWLWKASQKSTYLTTVGYDSMVRVWTGDQPALIRSREAIASILMIKPFVVSSRKIERMQLKAKLVYELKCAIT